MTTDNDSHAEPPNFAKWLMWLLRKDTWKRYPLIASIAAIITASVAVGAVYTVYSFILGDKSNGENFVQFENSTHGTLTREEKEALLKLIKNEPELLRSDSSPESAIAKRPGNVFWPVGSTISIAFMDGEEFLQKLVQETATEWMTHANLTFDFDAGIEESEVRITFIDEGNWSYKGVQSLGLSKQKATMSLSSLKKNLDLEDKKGIILHEFGHMLGLIHEHQTPNSLIPFNWQKMYSELSSAPNYWSKANVDFNYRKIDDAAKQYDAKEFDPSSIMMHGIRAALTTNGREYPFNTSLSEMDEAFVSKIYHGS